MKKLFATAALVIGLVGVAGNAMAATKAAYCAASAQNAVDTYTHPAGSALLGCGAGALLGQVLTHGQGAAVIGGCAAGGATGLVLSDAKRQKIYNDAYNNCMYGNSGYLAVPPPAPPPSPYPINWTHSATTPYSSSSNVRSGPGTNFPIVDQLPASTAVGVAFCNSSGWCRIGQQQWISQSLLTFN